jgi:alpha-glucosidase
MHDPSLTDNPPVEEEDEVRKRPFDFQHHLHNQSQLTLIPFIESLAKVVTSFGSDRFTVAEVGGEQALTEMKSFTAGDSRLNTSYGFDFLYSETLSPALILDALANWPDKAGEGWPSWAFSNHDAPRVVSRWDDGSDSDSRAKALLALLMCLRGNIFLYQGEELGLPQAKIAFEDLRDPEAIANWPLTQGRDGARTPMPWAENAPHAGFSIAKPWLPIPGDHAKRAVSMQNNEADSILMRTRELLELRRSNSALRTGRFEPLALPPPLLGFERVSTEMRVRCLFNLGSQRVSSDAFVDGECLFSCGDVNHSTGALGPWASCIMVAAVYA